MPNSFATPDLSLIRDMPKDESQLDGLHLEHFQKGPKDLYYIGSHHGTDIENLSHEIIRQTIVKYKPQLVIIEGLETAQGLSPSLGFDADKPVDMQRFYQSEENTHTAEFVRSRNIPFVGGEPSGEEVLKAFKNQGYSLEDGMGLYLLRHISAWKRDGSLADKEHFPAQANAFFSSNELFKDIPKESRITFDDFKIWYDAHKSDVGNKDFLDVSARDTNPVSSESANYFQKLSAVMDRIRDRHLVKLIADSLADKDRVLVVYGDAHLYKSEPVFEKLFGDAGHKERLSLQPEGMVAHEVVSSDRHAEVRSKNSAAILPKALEVGSVVLLAAAGLVALEVGFLAAAAVLASSALTFAGSKIADRTRHRSDPLVSDAPLSMTRQSAAPSKARAQSFDNPGRSDGQSWTQASVKSASEISRAV